MKRKVWIALGLTVLAGALRFYKASVTGFWMDEVFSMNVAQMRLADWPSFLLHQDFNPPLYYLLVKLCLHFLGANEWAGRLPSILAGTLSVPLLFAVVTEDGADFPAGMVAALLLAFSPFHIAYSQEARAYALMGMWGLCSVWSLQSFLRSQRLQELLWLLFFWGLMIGTHYWGYFVIGSELLYLVFFERMNPFIHSRAPLFTVFVVCFVGGGCLFLANQSSHIAPGILHPPLWRDFWSLFLAFGGIQFKIGEASLHLSGIFQYLVLFLLGGAMGLVVAGEKSLSMSRKVKLFSTIVCGTVLMPMIVSLKAPLFLPNRYPVMVVPLFLALTAFGVMRLPWRFRVVWLLLWAIPTGTALRSYYVAFPKSYARETARRLAAEVVPSDRVWSVPDFQTRTLGFYAVLPFYHYPETLPRTGHLYLVFNESLDAGRAENAAAFLSANGLVCTARERLWSEVIWRYSPSHK